MLIAFAKLIVLKWTDKHHLDIWMKFSKELKLLGLEGCADYTKGRMTMFTRSHHGKQRTA